MPLHKKITAIVIFAFCGFLGGWISQAQAADLPVTLNGDGTFSVTPVTYANSNANIFALPYDGQSDPSALIPAGYQCSNTAYSTFLGHQSQITMPYTISAGYTPLGGGAPDISSGDWWIVGQFVTSGVYPSCNTSGVGGGDTFYFHLNNETDPSYSAITSVAPSGTISSSSPLTITIGADIHSADVASSTANGGLLQIFSWVGGVDTAFVSPSHAWTVTAGGATTTSYQVTTDLPAGNFKIYASIYALDQYGAFGPTYSATTTFFTLNTSYFEHLTGTTTPYQLGYKNAPCGISDLSGCYQNAIAFLFYPSVSPGQAVSTISQSAQGKFPFVYAYQLGAIRTSLLTASSTAPTSLTVDLWKIPGQATSTIELLSETKVAAVPFSGTIYTVLTWLIWLFMAEYIYYRVIRMHDVNTPSS